MQMTVAELREQLEGCKPDAHVFIAYQPNYPMQESVPYDDEGFAIAGNGDVFIGGCGSNGYLNGEVAVRLGWAEGEAEEKEYDYE